MIRPILATLVALTVLACGDGAEDTPAEPPLSAVEAFPNLPLPPGGTALSTAGSGEALQLLLSTPVDADTVADYYRSVLARDPYRLLNESTTGPTVSFYVESGAKRPLWIQVERLGAGGTLVRMVGAERPTGDSVAPPPTPTATPGVGGS